MIREADLRSRSIRQIGSLPEGSIHGHVGNDLVILRGDSFGKRRAQVTTTFALHDAASGRLLFRFPGGTRSIVPLADGTWAVSGDIGANNVARVSATGEILSAGRVGAPRVLLGGEIRPGIVAIAELRRSSSEGERRLILADASTWRVVKTIPNVTATAIQWWWRGFDELGSPAPRVVTRAGEVYLIDPVTLEPKKVELR